jgi:hypothetical protein
MLDGKGVKQSFLCLFLLFLCATGANAQDLSFRAYVDKTEVTLNDQITLTIEVSGKQNLPDPELPTIEDFEVYSSGRSTNFSFVNGKVSSSVTYNYTMVPKKEGEFFIGAASLKYKDQIYQTQPIKIVVKAGRALTRKIPSGEELKGEVTASGGELFLQSKLDKKEVFVGEQITLDLKFYTSVRLIDQPQLTSPSYTGFWVEELSPQKQYYQVIEGKRYLVNEIKKALFATASGEFTIEPFELQVTVEGRRQRRDPFSIFDDDFFGLAGGREVRLKSDPLSVKVLPLPQIGELPSFAGAVGSFKISLSADTAKVEMNQPITTRIKVSGVGNIKTIGPPKFPELPDFRHYSSGSSENVDNRSDTISGSKIFEEVFIPKSPGKFSFPAIKYTFFNPETKAYETVSTKPLVITSLPSTQPLVAEIPGVSHSEIGAGIKDLLYLKTKLSLASKPGGLYRQAWFLALQVLPLGFLAFCWIYSNRKERLNADVAYARKRRAKRVGKRRLKAARKLLSAEKPSDFYGEITNALNGYLGDKFNLPAAGLTSVMIEQEMRSRGASSEIAPELKSLLQDCDFARFAPASDNPAQRQDFLRRAQKLIDNLEEVLTD